MRGGQAQARGDFPQAAQYYRQVLADDPGNMVVRRQLAQVLVHAGDFSEAAAMLEGVLAEVPGDPQATLYLGLALVGTGGRDRGFDLLAGYRHWQAPREQQVVSDAARLLRGRTDMGIEDLVQAMEQAQARGWEEELRERRSMHVGRGQ